MEKLEILFVRACKSQMSNKQTSGVYRRFYYNRPSPLSNEDQPICGILLRICEKYCPVNTMDLVERMSPYYVNMYGNKPYWEHLRIFLEGHIANTEVSKFPNYTRPAWFRNKYMR